MEVHGSCHCGDVTYEADVDPQLVYVCNCTDCQVLTGSAFRITVAAAAGDFRLRSGTPTTYVKIADSGARRRHAFCPRCGAPVYACADADAPPTFSLRVGCLAEKHELPPQRQAWCRSALAWTRDLGTLPGRDGQ